MGASADRGGHAREVQGAPTAAGRDEAGRGLRLHGRSGRHRAGLRVDASSGTPLFTDGPYVETKEYLGGFAIVDVPDEAAARFWAGRIATACGWPQEVRRFQVPTRSPVDPD